MKPGSVQEASRYFVCGQAQEAKCPFCGYLVEWTNNIQYCAGCGVVYKVRKNKVFFDRSKVSPLFRVQQSGGVHLRPTSG